MRVALVLVLCSGCSSILGIDNFKLADAGTDNEGMDGPSVDAAANCLGVDGFFVCDVMPTAPVQFVAGSSLLNTDSDPLCRPAPNGWPANVPACFLIGTTISLPQTLQFIGTHPLVMVATDTITIPNGITLDAAAHTGAPASMRPAGSIATACTPPQAPMDGNGFQGAGGAAGGTFGGKGGNGGDGEAGNIKAGLAQATMAAPTTLRGGCDGGRGGAAVGNPGPGGVGGGAVYLVAKNRIQIDGIVNASGAGGLAGEQLTGGGGGGSGGMILLVAPEIRGAGIVVANGGGGASGGSASAPGQPGRDPSPMSPSVQAPPGNNPNAGIGGRGAAGANQAQNGGLGNIMAGGGAGGGGFGYIPVSTAPNGIVASPAVSIIL